MAAETIGCVLRCKTEKSRTSVVYCAFECGNFAHEDCLSKRRYPMYWKRFDEKPGERFHCENCDTVKPSELKGGTSKEGVLKRVSTMNIMLSQFMDGVKDMVDKNGKLKAEISALKAEIESLKVQRGVKINTQIPELPQLPVDGADVETTPKSTGGRSRRARKRRRVTPSSCGSSTPCEQTPSMAKEIEKHTLAISNLPG